MNFEKDSLCPSTPGTVKTVSDNIPRAIMLNSISTSNISPEISQKLDVEKYKSMLQLFDNNNSINAVTTEESSQFHDPYSLISETLRSTEKNSFIKDNEFETVYESENTKKSLSRTSFLEANNFANEITSNKYYESLIQLENIGEKDIFNEGISSTDYKRPSYSNTSESEFQQNKQVEEFIAALKIQRTFRNYRSRKRFCDIANTIFSLCKMPTPALLCAINKKLYDSVDFKLQDVKILIRLRGPEFPPKPIYRVIIKMKTFNTKVSSLKWNYDYNKQKQSLINKESGWYELFPEETEADKYNNCGNQVFVPASTIKQAKELILTRNIQNSTEQYANQRNIPYTKIMKRNSLTPSDGNNNLKVQKNRNKHSIEEIEKRKAILEHAERMKIVFGMNQKKNENDSNNSYESIAKSLSTTLRTNDPQYPIDGIENLEVFNVSKSFKTGISTPPFENEVDIENFSFNTDAIDACLSSSKKRVWDMI